MNDLTKILNNPEEHYPGNFDTPQRANALLTGLCQDAAKEIERLNAEVERLKASIALDKMAENARALGLDYEPAVQDGRDWSLLEATQESLREHMAEIKRLKAAQPVKTYSDGKPWPVAPKPWVGLTDEEAKRVFNDEHCNISADLAGMLARAIEAKLKGKNHG